MLSLGDSKLIETLLSKDFYLDTFGALECKVFIIKSNKFKIDDPEVL